ncbi:hypothetical protein FB45DRAFT_474174 [Roridomyces roridus]|uniref:Uncharacterized protein n=1 Tax=Roridomyces roridus TaxID=1738132 RepID=A0AAD7FRW8_9AGAR|nr:hypothetical protein FB45DRAFT_474174 [Roridomyces roridus]
MSALRWLLAELKKLASTLAGASIRGLLSLISALFRVVLKKRPASTPGFTKDLQTIRIVYPPSNDHPGIPLHGAALEENVTSFSLLPAALNAHNAPYRHSGPSASRSSQDISAALPTQERYSLHSLSVSHLPSTNQHPTAAASVQDLSSRPPSPGLALGGYMPSTNPSVVDITVDPPETESPAESPQSSRVFGDVVASTALINEHYRRIFPGIPDSVRRYERKVSVPDEPTQFTIPSLTIRMDPVPAPSGWMVCQHPEGAQYFFHKEKRVFTDANLYDPDTFQFMTTQINLILDFLRAHNVILQPNVDLVVDEWVYEDGEKGVQYYFANHQDRCVFWMDKTDADLFPVTFEIPGVTSASHIRHILEAQYWYHCELFPRSLQVTELMVDELRDLVLHALGDLVTSVTSTVSWNSEDLNSILTLVDGLAKNIGRNTDNKFNGCSCLVGPWHNIVASVCV